ncbi:hypothetical protein ACFX2I_010576 [Malus domestica]
MASSLAFLQPLSNVSSTSTLLFLCNPHHIPSSSSSLKPSNFPKTLPLKSLTASFSLAESDSPKSFQPNGPNFQSFLQELAVSIHFPFRIRSLTFDLPPDYFAQLPNDLRLNLNDAAFDLSNGRVVDECGQELGETLLNLSRAWEQADTSTSHALASKLPGSLIQELISVIIAFGKHLVSAGRRFQSMGQYGQGELQKVFYQLGGRLSWERAYLLLF